MTFSLIGVLALRIQIVLLDEAVFIVTTRSWQRSSAVAAGFKPRIAPSSLLSYSVASIDPVGVNIYGGGEVVDVGLKSLAADFALEVADTRFLFDGD